MINRLDASYLQSVIQFYSLIIFPFLLGSSIRATDIKIGYSLRVRKSLLKYICEAQTERSNWVRISEWHSFHKCLSSISVKRQSSLLSFWQIGQEIILSLGMKKASFKKIKCIPSVVFSISTSLEREKMELV